MSSAQSEPAFAFVAGALDRADALRGDEDGLKALRARGRAIALDAQGCVRLYADGHWQPEAPRADSTFLGLDAEATPWFAQSLAGADVRNEAVSTVTIDLRRAASEWPCAQATLFAQARAVLHWQATYRHCPRCGGILALQRAGWQAHCAACETRHFPRTDPAVIVAVSDGDRLLLGRQASWQPATRYSTLAGFVEPGESLEAAVRREVLEESGVRVREAHYLASQPWPFPGSLMLGFLALAEPDVPRVDGVELQHARWFTRAEVAAALRGEGESTLVLSPPLSISRWLIECWASGAATIAGHF